ncbi:MAG: hypothetical protein M1308_09810 [Actinobacteria bacterium]|nr:hypothetical protein [Actinomycetota bacterium]
MKRYLGLIIIVFLVILSALIYGCDRSSVDKKANTQVTQILNVSDIQSDPAAFKGTITINGVMAGVLDNDAKIFAIVDTAEVLACQSINCGMFYLPIKYDGGELPKPEEEINVTGSFSGSGNNIMFVATKYEVLRKNILKGGQ